MPATIKQMVHDSGFQGSSKLFKHLVEEYQNRPFTMDELLADKKIMKIMVSSAPSADKTASKSKSSNPKTKFTTLPPIAKICPFFIVVPA